GTGSADVLSADFVHLVTEAAKLAFADRDAHYADPLFADVPLEALLSPGYAAERAALVGGEASMELRPGSPAGRAPFIPELTVAGTAPGTDRTNGEPTVDRAGTQRGDTCHLDVVDSAGNMVASKPSGGWLDRSPLLPAVGFLLGGRGQLFWLVPRSLGIIAPGNRQLTTHTPTLVTREGVGVTALGTRGGDQQVQCSL